MRTLATVLILSALAAPAMAQQAAPSAQQLHLRYLTWPGKVAPQTRQTQPQPGQPAQIQAAASQAPRDPAFSMRYRPVQHGPNHFLGQVTPAQQAAIDQQRATDRAEAEKALALAQAAKAKAEAEQQQQRAEVRSAPLPPAALPNSIYAAPPPRMAQAQPSQPAASTAVAGGYDQHARFYSLHRPFGQQPDPVALSPQFLATPSADLADPPPPPAPRILPGQTGTAAQQTAARVAARDSSD